jgi:sugar (pentulose or hexulose) kinase
MSKSGKLFLGIELGSTRIKAVLIDEGCAIAASGGHDWENRLENGIWTYSLDDVWAGVQDAFLKLSENYRQSFGRPLTKIDAIGVSAMMHGYLPFDKNDNQLAGFRTWRNTITGQASELLTKEFGFNVPQRWSAAHLFQAILNGENHVGDISFLTTLAGYVHYKLTGKKVLGVGDASGMFPIDSGVNKFNAGMLSKFDALAAQKGVNWKLSGILPQVLLAGEEAGSLTEEGAKLLDPSGILEPGAAACPPEGDAGTGMVATNSVAQRTGNVSAGTSVFAMLVLEKPLSKLYTEIDMVTTPTGKPVAMVHCNNCTSDFDGWVKLLGEAAALMGGNFTKPELYDSLYNIALNADKDAGGLVACNYLSGEHLTGFTQGRPLFARTPDSSFTLANFMRALLFSSMSTLKLGMDILTGKEGVKLEKLLGHGGLFKTKSVGQKLMADALSVPVAVMESAGEGGAWGIALLAAYAYLKSDGETLEGFLCEKVFRGAGVSLAQPDGDGVNGFKEYMRRYVGLLEVERAAVENLENRGG